MEPRLVKIGEAARLIGSAPDTLRRWEATGELLPARKTAWWHPLLRRRRPARPDQRAMCPPSHMPASQAMTRRPTWSAAGGTGSVLRGRKAALRGHLRLGLGLNYRKKWPAAAAGTDSQAAHAPPGADAQGSPATLRRRARLCAVRGARHRDPRDRQVRGRLWTGSPPSSRNWHRTYWRSSRCFRPGFTARGRTRHVSSWMS